jgi:hypothetical protein
MVPNPAFQINYELRKDQLGRASAVRRDLMVVDIQTWNNQDKITFGYCHTLRSSLMRHVVGFTKKITEQPFHIVEDQTLQFSVGQFVKIEPSDDWLQIYQVGTQVHVDRLYITVIVGDPLPGGSLSKGENWSAAVDWTKSYPQ